MGILTEEKIKTSMKALVIEPDPLVVQKVSNLLRKSGYIVVNCTQINKGKEFLEREKPSIVIANIPREKEGQNNEFFRWIKTQENPPYLLGLSDDSSFLQSVINQNENYRHVDRVLSKKPLDEQLFSRQLISKNWDIQNPPLSGKVSVSKKNRRKNKVQNLVSDSNRLQSLLDHAPVALALLDTNLVYKDVNARWCQDFGKTRYEWLGGSHYQLFPNLHPNWKEVFNETLIDGKSWEQTEVINSSNLAISWKISPYKSETGHIDGILISSGFETIAEGQKKEKELAPKKNEEAETKTEELKQPEIPTSPEQIEEALMQGVPIPEPSRDFSAKVPQTPIEQFHEQSKISLASTEIAYWESETSLDKWDVFEGNLYKKWGFSKEEILSPKFLEGRMGEKNWENYMKTYSDAISSKKEGFSYTFQLKSSSFDQIFWIRDHITIEYEGSIPVRVCGILVDFTKEKIIANESQAKEEIFEKGLYNAPECLWMTKDLTPHISYFNQKWLQFAGRKSIEEYGFGWTNRILLNKRDSVLTKLQTLMEEEKNIAIEIPIRNSEGLYEDILFLGRPVRNKDGKSFYVGVCRTKERPEENLPKKDKDKQSNEKSKLEKYSMLDLFPEACAIIDKNRKCLYANKLFQDNFGKDIVESKCIRVWLVSHMPSSNLLKHEYHNIHRSLEKSGKKSIIKLYDKKGSVHHLKIYSKDTKDSRRIVFFEDATKEIRANQVWNISEQKFRLIFEKSAIGAVVLSPLGDIMHANAQSLKIFSKSSKDFYREPFISSLDKSVRGEYLKYIKSALENGKNKYHYAEFLLNLEEYNGKKISLSSSVFHISKSKTPYLIHFVQECDKEQIIEEESEDVVQPFIVDSVDDEAQLEAVSPIKKEEVLSIDEQINTLFYKVSHLFFWLDNSGTILKYFGNIGNYLEDKTLEGEKLSKIISKSDYSEIAEKLANVNKDGEKWRKIVCYRAKAGLEGYFVMDFSSIIDQEGNLSFLVIAQDCTKEEELKRDLSKNIDHYQNVFSKSRIGMFEMNARGKNVQLHWQLQKVLKLKNIRGKCHSNVWLNLFEKEDKKRFLEKLDKLKQGKITSFDFLLNRKEISQKLYTKVFKGEKNKIIGLQMEVFRIQLQSKKTKPLKENLFQLKREDHLRAIQLGFENVASIVNYFQTDYFSIKEAEKWDKIHGFVSSLSLLQGAVKKNDFNYSLLLEKVFLNIVRRYGLSEGKNNIEVSSIFEKNAEKISYFVIVFSELFEELILLAKENRSELSVSIRQEGKAYRIKSRFYGKNESYNFEPKNLLFFFLEQWNIEYKLHERENGYIDFSLCYSS